MNERYDKIRNQPWPRENGRVRMSMEERAKIFMPFAALKGYEDIIAERQTLAMTEQRERMPTDDPDYEM